MSPDTPTTDHGSPLAAELARLAESVATEAAELALRRRHQGIELAGTKSSRSDVVTAADLAVEQLIRDRIAAARPGDAVLGEEGGTGQQPPSGSPAAAVTWIVDPIDGTVNYVYGIPAWSVSVAAAVGDPAVGDPAAGGSVVAGCVVNPVTGEVFTAAAGHGARRNGESLTAAAQPPELAVSLVGTGFGYTAVNRAVDGWVAGQLLPQVRDIRRIGSASLDLCMVATGQLDAYYERGLNRWDHAAGGLVAAEAGYTVAGLAGRAADREFLLAAPAGLWDRLYDALRPLFADPRGARGPQ